MSTTPSYLLVDGHNVMHAWPELARHMRSASKRPIARAELIQRLRHLQDMTGTQVVVVFDGTTAKITEEREPDGLQVIYADAGHTADDLIEKLAARYAKERPMRVASADGLVRETVAAFGADWLSPEMLKSMPNARCAGRSTSSRPADICSRGSVSAVRAWRFLPGLGKQSPSPSAALVWRRRRSIAPSAKARRCS
jgi:hypothetical protein